MRTTWTLRAGVPLLSCLLGCAAAAGGSSSDLDPSGGGKGADPDGGVVPSCPPPCQAVRWGEGGTPFDPGDPDQLHDGVGADVRGWLTLGDRVTSDSAVWVANSGEGTVSKLDAESGRVLCEASIQSRPSTLEL